MSKRKANGRSAGRTSGNGKGKQQASGRRPRGTEGLSERRNDGGGATIRGSASLRSGPRTAAGAGGGAPAAASKKTSAERRNVAKAGRKGSDARTVAGTPFLLGDELTIDMIGLTHDGEGVGRTDGFTLFVAGALPGEQVRAEVAVLKKNYGYARMKKLVRPSASRLEPPCPVYSDCGGCQLQHMDYAAQLDWKRQLVIDNLTRIGHLTVADGLHAPGERDRVGEADAPAKQATPAEQAAAGIIVKPTIGMEHPWHYRNKAAMPVGDDGKGGLAAGFYARGSHQIVDTDRCLIQHKRNDETVQTVKRIARELRIAPYREESGEGVLRHIVVRNGIISGQVMVVLITKERRLPRKPEFIEHIRQAVPGVASIVQNINPRQTNAIFGDETVVLWGNDVIYDELDGLRFAISARSFYQVNPLQTVALYRKAVEYAGLTGKERVIDAYCGIGTISLFLARQAAHVYGVEIVPEAIADAKRNAELNQLDNATFETGPAEVVIPRWRSEGIEADVIVVDPPRKGCDQALLETILDIRPERIVYVSCNPSTLARDLRVLEDGGYKAVEVTPVDMFPWTGHTEAVSLLVWSGTDGENP